MVRFSDTLSMTGKVIRLHPSIIIYPFFAVLGQFALEAMAPASGTDSRALDLISTALVLVAACGGATAFTYPFFKMGYAVATALGRPTHRSWTPWKAALGLAYPWLVAKAIIVLGTMLLGFCLLVPGVLYSSFIWPFFPLLFGPRFNIWTSLSLGKRLVKESTGWVGGLGLASTLLIVSAVGGQLFGIPFLSKTLLETPFAETIPAIEMLVNATLGWLIVLFCIFPSVSALMLAEDLHEPIFNAEYEAERQREDLEELHDYFEESVLPALTVEPDIDAKIEALRDLRARGIISEDDFNRELDELRSF